MQIRSGPGSNGKNVNNFSNTRSLPLSVGNHICDWESGFLPELMSSDLIPLHCGECSSFGVPLLGKKWRWWGLQQRKLIKSVHPEGTRSVYLHPSAEWSILMGASDSGTCFTQTSIFMWVECLRFFWGLYVFCSIYLRMGAISSKSGWRSMGLDTTRAPL